MRQIGDHQTDASSLNPTDEVLELVSKISMSLKKSSETRSRP